MKTLLAILTLALGSLAEAQDKPITKDQIAATVRHLQALSREQAKELDEVKAVLVAQDGQLAAAQGESLTLKQDIEKLTTWGVEQQARADAAELRATSFEKRAVAAEKHLSRIKTWLSVVLAVCLMALVNYLPFGFFPPPMSLYLRAAASIGAAGAAFLLVARFV